MMQRLKYGFITLAVVAAGLFFVQPAFAAPGDVLEKGGCTADTALCSDSGDGVFTLIRSIIQIMLIIAGIVAVIMIIVGGIGYSTSAGDPAKTKKAKDTVLYSIVGLVVAIMAYAVVTFVVGKL
jgi:heme/copper-type cytochrome/quinol oxidase subunit 2